MIVAFAFGEPIFVSLGIYGLVLGGAFMVWAIRNALAAAASILKTVPIVASLRSVPVHWWLTAVWTSILLFIVLFTQFFTELQRGRRVPTPRRARRPYGAIENGLRAGFEYWRGEQDTVRGDCAVAVLPGGHPGVRVVHPRPVVRSASAGSLRRPTLVGQTLVWWGVASFTAHSWAGERMPWLIIHPLLPFVILAGLGVQVLWDNRRCGVPRYRSRRCARSACCGR